MYTRLFFGEIQQGKAEEAWQILSEFAQRVKQQKGCVLNQVLQSGNEIVGISSWETQQDLASYAEGELARELKAELQKNNVDAFGEIIHENWELKRSLTGGISSGAIDDWYNRARKSGAERMGSGRRYWADEIFLIFT